MKKKRLGYLGPIYSFSYEAAWKHYGRKVIMIPMKNFNEIVDSVESGAIDLGIIPFWNPYEEHIRESQEKIFNSGVIATAIIKEKIDLCLCCSQSIPLSEIRSLISNEHVFKQCDKWLAENMARAKIRYTLSTAKAAKEIKKKKYVAAICSKKVIKKNGLFCLAKKIENEGNTTLFFVIEKDDKSKLTGKYCLVAINLYENSQKKRNFRYSGRAWFFSYPKFYSSTSERRI